MERELTAATETTGCRRLAKDCSLSRNLSSHLRKEMACSAFLAFTKNDLETCCHDAISILMARIVGCAALS